MADNDKSQRSRYERTAREIEEKYKPKPIGEWLKEKHPRLYQEVRGDIELGITGNISADGRDTSSSNVRLSVKNLPDDVKADYAHYRDRIASEKGIAIAEAEDNGRLDVGYETSDKDPDNKAMTESAANKARANLGRGRPAREGAFDIGAIGKTGGTKAYRVNYGNLATALQFAPDLQFLLSKGGSAAIYGEGNVTPEDGPRSENLVEVALTGEGQEANRRHEYQPTAQGRRPVRGSGAERNDVLSASIEANRPAIARDGATGNVTLARAMGYLNTLQRSDLVRLQQHMVSAGLYSDVEGGESTITENRILWGVASDPRTIKAWQQVLLEQLQDPDKSLAEVLHNREVAYAPRLAALLSGTASGAAGGGGTVEVTLSDPDTVRLAAEQYFVESLGRFPTDAEVDKLVTTIHAAQNAVGQQKLASWRAGVDATKGTAVVQPGSRAELDAILGGGKLFFPVPGGKYSNDWGQARSGNRGHQGTDIFAPTGTPVRAAKDGTLKKTGDGGVQGHMLSLSITGSDGNNYFYNHMDPNRVVVRPGQKIKAGDIIGYVGDAPGLIGTASHLHFSINERTDRAQNPFPLLQAAQGRNAALPVGPELVPESERVVDAMGRVEAIEDVDVASSVAMQAREDHPVEYGAQQLGNAYDDLVKLLTGEAVG